MAKSLIQHMQDRNKLQLKNGDELQGKKLTPTPFENKVETEMQERKYAKSKTPKTPAYEIEESIKQPLREKYSSQDEKVKSAIEKGKLRGEVNYYKNREAKLGGKKKVDKRIKSKQRKKKISDFVKKNAVGATIAAGAIGHFINEELKAKN